MTLQVTPARARALEQAKQGEVYVMTKEAFQQLALLEYSCSLPTPSHATDGRPYIFCRNLRAYRPPRHGAPTVEDTEWFIAEVSAADAAGYATIRWTPVVFDGPPIEWSRAFL